MLVQSFALKINFRVNSRSLINGDHVPIILKTTIALCTAPYHVFVSIFGYFDSKTKLEACFLGESQNLEKHLGIIWIYQEI